MLKMNNFEKIMFLNLWFINTEIIFTTIVTAL